MHIEHSNGFRDRWVSTYPKDRRSQTSMFTGYIRLLQNGMSNLDLITLPTSIGFQPLRYLSTHTSYIYSSNNSRSLLSLNEFNPAGSKLRKYFYRGEPRANVHLSEKWYLPYEAICSDQISGTFKSTCNLSSHFSFTHRTRLFQATATALLVKTYPNHRYKRCVSTFTEGESEASGCPSRKWFLPYKANCSDPLTASLE